MVGAVCLVWCVVCCDVPRFGICACFVCVDYWSSFLVLYVVPVLYVIVHVSCLLFDL